MQAIYEQRKHDFYCRECPAHTAATLGYRSHLHYQIELAMVFSGHTRATVDSTVYDVFGGDILVVFPNQIHDFQTIEKEHYILLKFSPDIISDLLHPFTASLPCSNVIRGGANDEELLWLIKTISGLYYSGDAPFQETVLHGCLLAFCGKMLQKMELRDIQSGDYHAVGMIMNYCSMHSDKDLSLSMLEKELHLSKYYISHIMSNKLHIGFNDYVNSLRISNACHHLVKTDYTVTEISELVGFNTLRTFNRAFLKQMGCTPREYRQKKRSGMGVHP